MMGLLKTSNNEHAAAWKLWQQNPCWQELLTIIDDIKKDSVRDEDRVPIENLNVGITAHSRGVRFGVDKLLRKIDEIVNQK